MTMTYAQPLPRRYRRGRLAVPALWREVVRRREEGTEPDRLITEEHAEELRAALDR
ncbi:hypothetical protein AB0E69_15795 [Kribbella sp. NPDC026611]|uniref:hypothetical protein n=1 Tax=Kribbella sp. NPDC026611 TaxID=3154911 RepID=UPI0033D07E19